MAFVRKRGRRWRVRFVDERGVQVERTVRAATKSEAQRMADDLERRAERIRLGLESAVMELSLRDAYEKHFKPIIQGRGGFKSMDSRLRLHVLPTLGDKLVHQVKPADIEALLAAKEREGYSPQTREHIRVEVSSLFTFTIERLKAFAGENPARAVPEVVIPEKPPKWLPAEHVEALLSHVPDRWRGLVAVGVYAGLRWSEARGLRVSDVLLEQQLLCIWWTSSGSTKTRKVRHVPVPDELVPYLKVELGRVRSEWLFPRANGKMLTKDFPVNGVIRRAARRAGLIVGYDHICRTRGRKHGCGAEPERRADEARSDCPRCGKLREVKAVPLAISFKDLRSTFGTHGAEHARDLRSVQRSLGHASLATTEKKYAFARDRHFVEQLKGLSYKPARPEPAKKDEKEQEPTTTDKVVRLEQAAKRRR